MKGHDFENFFNNMHYIDIDYINRSFHEWNNISIDFLSSWFINKSLPIFLSKVSFGALLISMFFYWFQAMFQYNNLEVHLNGKHHKLIIGKVPSLAMWLANITLALMLFIRWIESGHFPLSNLYESLLFLSWGLTSIHLFFENALNKENQNGSLMKPEFLPTETVKSKKSMQSTLTLGAITSPLSLFTNAFATFSLPQEMQKVTVLVPALQSNWLIMHVSVMIISYAALLSGSLLAMAFLVIQFSFRTDNKKSHINSPISTKTFERAAPMHTHISETLGYPKKVRVNTIKKKDEKWNEPTPCFVDEDSTLPPSAVQTVQKNSVTSLSTSSRPIPPYEYEVQLPRRTSLGSFAHPSDSIPTSAFRGTRSTGHSTISVGKSAGMEAGLPADPVRSTGVEVQLPPDARRGQQEVQHLSRTEYRASGGSCTSTPVLRTGSAEEESGLKNKEKYLAEQQGMLLSKKALKVTSNSTLNSSFSFFKLVFPRVRNTIKLENFLESIAFQLFKVRKLFTDCFYENMKKKDPPGYLTSEWLGVASQPKDLLETLDNLSYRSIGLGFALLTIGILSGAVWANEAWGSYWSWDPKETWAFVTWLIFALYLHTRLSKGWVGKESAFVATFGFGVVWFCYLGVNFFGKGLHSYGWMR